MSVEEYKALIEEARSKTDSVVAPWGWVAYPTTTRKSEPYPSIDPGFDGEAWTISEPYCGEGVWCGDGECAGVCGAEVIRTGAEGCEDDWMEPRVALFLADAPEYIRKLASAVEALVAENERLRTQLDQVRKALTKDRVIMVERHNGYTVENYSNPLVPVKAIEAALAAAVQVDPVSLEPVPVVSSPTEGEK